MLARENGITLIELMIAMALGLFVLASLVVLYVSAEKNIMAQEALISIEENTQIAFQLLRKNIRTAGYIGCPSLTKTFSVKNYPLTIWHKIEGYQDNKSDVITVRQASTQSADVLVPMYDQSIMVVSSKPVFHQGDLLLISNCQSAEAFTVKNVFSQKDGIQKIIINTPLSRLYEERAEVSHLESHTYFINQHGLFVRDQNNITIELVEGIDEMIINYDVENNGQLARMFASEISDWSSVKGVEIKLAVSSTNNFPLKKIGYAYVALREG